MHQAQVHPPASEKRVKEIFALHTGQRKDIIPIEVTVIRSDGVEVPVEIDAQMLQGIFRDLTERKRAEARLRESEERHRTLFETMTQGVVYQDAEGKIVSANPAAERILGFSLDQMRGKTMTDPCWKAVDEGGSDFPSEMHPSIAALRTGKPVRDVVIGIYNSNEKKRRWISVDAVPLFKPGQEKPYQVYTTFSDITERRLVENVLRESRDLLQQRSRELEKVVAELAAVNKELEAFSYSVSHDLRAPLRQIKGFIQLVLDDYGDELSEEGRDYLRRISSLSLRATELINDLLEFSRISGSEMVREDVNLSELVREISQGLQKENPEHKVTMDIEDDVHANGDVRLLRVMLVNLINNAWKFSSKVDKPVISFGIKRVEDKDAFFISDNGVGFKQEDAEKLFVPFKRLHPRGEFDGVGVGLATVRRVVNKHGGTIWAEGRPGKGATFYFTLS